MLSAGSEKNLSDGYNRLDDMGTELVWEWFSPRLGGGLGVARTTAGWSSAPTTTAGIRVTTPTGTTPLQRERRLRPQLIPILFLRKLEPLRGRPIARKRQPGIRGRRPFLQQRDIRRLADWVDGGRVQAEDHDAGKGEKENNCEDTLHDLFSQKLENERMSSVSSP